MQTNREIVLRDERIATQRRQLEGLQRTVEHLVEEKRILRATNRKLRQSLDEWIRYASTAYGTTPPAVPTEEES